MDNVETFNLKGKFSYSRLEKFNNCPYSYKLTYLDGNYVPANSLALSIGTLLHKVNEYIGNKIILGETIDYDLLLRYIDRAGKDVSLDDLDSDKTQNEVIEGTDILKEKYFEDWLDIKTKSGKSMKQKVQYFKDNIKNMETRIKNSEWTVYKTEEPFEFTYKGVIFKGFIDRIDINKITGELRVIDYKTKDALFADKDLTTPLQFIVYALAIQEKFGKIPSEYIYDLPLIGVQQEACTKGYLARGEKKLTKILEELTKSEFAPTPSPLCAWCPYSVTNKNAIEPYNHLCKYYSLWTPTNKTFEVNCKYGSLFILNP